EAKRGRGIDRDQSWMDAGQAVIVGDPARYAGRRDRDDGPCGKVPDGPTAPDQARRGLLDRCSGHASAAFPVQRFQNEGANSTRMVNNSNLPVSMHRESTHLAAAGRWPKFSRAPTVPRPGPTLLMVEFTAVAAVMMSTPEAVTARVEKANTVIHKMKKAWIEVMISGFTAFPLWRTTKMALGFISRRISLIPFL